MGNVKVVKLEISTANDESIPKTSEEITVDNSGVIAIPNEFVDQDVGAAIIKTVTIHLMEPTDEDMEQYHINIDIIGCSKNIRGLIFFLKCMDIAFVINYIFTSIPYSWALIPNCSFVQFCSTKRNC